MVDIGSTLDGGNFWLPTSGMDSRGGYAVETGGPLFLLGPFIFSSARSLQHQDLTDPG